MYNSSEYTNTYEYTIIKLIYVYNYLTDVHIRIIYFPLFASDFAHFSPPYNMYQGIVTIKENN